MSILTNIYKQGSTVVSELKGMNKALSDMSKRDKTAYQLDARQRKYEKERDKRERQDKKKVFQTVTDSVDQKVEKAGTAENKQAKQLQAGLGTAIANAIKGAKKGSPLKQATGGGQGGIAPGS